MAFYLAAGPARVGLAMTGLGLVWLVHGATGSYGRAGLAAGALAVAEALIAPQVAGLIDRLGQTRVVPALSVAHGACVTGLVAGWPPMVLAGHSASSLAGPLYAVTSAASLLSGFLYGRRPRRLRLQTAFLALAAGCVPLLLVDTPAALAATLVLPGFAIAPILTLSAVLTETRASPELLTQAFTWLGSASAAGVATAAALGGQLVDAFGTRASFALAVAAASLAAMLATRMR